MKVVCIVSLVHSGSTLLDLMLGGHPRFVGLGELASFLDPQWDHMSRIEAQRCSCGDTLKGCPFWGPFCALFQDRAPASRRARYELLLEAFRGHFGGGRVLVDSSKSLETVRAWTEVVGRDDVRVRGRHPASSETGPARRSESPAPLRCRRTRCQLPRPRRTVLVPRPPSP